MLRKMSKNNIGAQLDRILGSQAAYKIVAFLLLLSIIMGSFHVNQSYAWFTDASESPFSLESGKVHYVISYTTDPGLMVPGKDLIKNCTVKNLSSIDTQFRLKLEYDVWEADTGYPADPTKVISSSAIYTTNASIAPGTVLDKQYLNIAWAQKDGKDQFVAQQVTNGSITETFWSYHTTVSAVTKTAIEDKSGVDIPVFEKLLYDGPKTTNLFAGQPIVVKLTLQAKQADHIKWEEITLFEKFTE